jgi:DNA-binding LacI/PurR family transcriptional regulator
VSEVVTLDELAELSGVSRATVSRVINGGPVAPATRRRVLAVLDETGYRPNVAARSLASGRSGVVGVVMHVPPRMLFEDAYFAQLLHGMSDALGDEAAGMMLWLGSRSKEETLGQILRIGLIDGVIVTADQVEDPLVDGLLASKLATVLVGHRRADRNASYVDVDNARAAAAVTAHLVSVGCRRIGHVAGRPGSVAASERLLGYRRAMDRAGLLADDLVAEGSYTSESGALAADLLLDRDVDGIFCANDAMAVGALEAIRARGLCVPDDVALAGFDDLEFAARLDPPLTTVRQRVDEQGHQAAKTLLDLLRSPEEGPRRVVLPTELVIRRSTAREGPRRSDEGRDMQQRSASGVATGHR